MSNGSFYFRDNPAFTGGSPQAVYEELWERGRRQRLIWSGVVGAAFLLIGAKLLTPAWGVLLGMIGSGGATAWQWWQRAMHSVWLHGRRGERRTARILRFTLESRGYRVLHGRSVPGYGNLDQLVIGPTGVWAVGNQSFAPDTEFAMYGGKLFVGKDAGSPVITKLGEAARTVSRLMSARLNDETEVAVAPLLIVYGGKLPSGLMESGEGITLTRSYRLPRLISRPRGPGARNPDAAQERLNRERIDRLSQAAIHALPIGDHTMVAR